MLIPPMLVPELRDPLELTDGSRIRFLALCLLHCDELELKLAGGLDQLLAKFAGAGTTELFDLTRPSVCP